MLSATELPGGLRGRALAIGLTLAALGLSWVVVAAPLLDWYADRTETLAERQHLAARMTALAASAPDLQRQLTATEEGRSAAPAATLLTGSSDGLAGAALQEQLQAMARSAGTTLSSVEMLPTTQAAAYRRIALRVAATASWPVLVHLLAAIDQATPRMLVDDLRLAGTMLPSERGAPPLDANFTVVAFRASGAPVTPGAAATP